MTRSPPPYDGDREQLEHALTVLLVATRDPRGRMSGRKTVLRTIISSLASLGHRVIVAFFGAEEENDGSCQASFFVPLPRPSMLEVTANVAAGFAVSRRSLNECLYASRAAGAQLRRLVKDQCVDLVVTDMIRTASYGEETGLPWIADLDDLLSLRYERMSASALGSDVAELLLGYHKSAALTLGSKLALPMMRRVLRREAAILNHREQAVAASASLTTTVSPLEAHQLAAATGVRIAWTPMALSGPDHYPPLWERPKQMVFLGGLDYLPNWQSMLQFKENLLPELTADGTLVELDILGAPRRDTNVVWPEPMNHLGYIKDLDAALQAYKAMLVPAGLRGGLKTKIIHAALNGTLLVVHPDALDGSGLTPDRDVLVWEGSEELSRHLLRLNRGDRSLESVVSNARTWAQSNFSEEALRERWAANVEAALHAAEGLSAAA